MGRKKTKNYYWTEETEQAIIKYNDTDDENIKNKLLKTKNNFGKSYNISYKTRKNKEILSSNEKGDPTVIKIIIIKQVKVII